MLILFIFTTSDLRMKCTEMVYTVPARDSDLPSLLHFRHSNLIKVDIVFIFNKCIEVLLVISVLQHYMLLNSSILDFIQSLCNANSFVQTRD